MSEPDQHQPISLTKPLPNTGIAVSYPSPHPSPPGFRAPTNYPSPGGFPPGPVSGYPPGPMAGYPPQAQPPYPVLSTTTVVQRSNAEIVIAWIFTALTALYMLPWAVAATRRSTNSILIAVATFFLAWTGIGWLVLLVLSFLGPTVYTVHTSTTFVAPPAPPAGVWAHCPTDPPHVRRWWDGRVWTAHTTVG